MLAPFGAAKKSIIFREFCSVKFTSGLKMCLPGANTYLAALCDTTNRWSQCSKVSLRVKVSLRAMCAVWSFGVTMPSADRDD